MRQCIIITAIMVIAACGHTTTPPEDGFEPYLDEFRRQAWLSGCNVVPTDLRAVTITLVPETSMPFNRGRQAVARCQRIATPAVDVAMEWWERADGIEREAVLFHELGHCLLDRDDVSLFDAAGVSLSLMNMDIPPVLEYRLNRALLLEELFCPKEGSK